MREIDRSLLISKSLISETGCWLWQKAKVSGYGVIWSRGKMQRVHRLMYELLHGPIPEGMQVCHRCDTPACFNPDHLFLGTARDNAQDALKKGRLVIPLYSPPLKPFCKHGHPLQGENIRLHKNGKRRCRTCDNHSRSIRRLKRLHIETS